MKVIAKQIGEYPQGTWRQPGEKFEFNREKKASWMLTEAEATKSKAQDRTDAEDAAEINRAVSEAMAKAKAKIKARKEAESKGKPGITKEEAAALAKEKANAEKEFYAVHKGFGKYDVLGLDERVVENGGGLKKADAAALVELLLAE